MKKVLLATSILAATAGFAAADITLSGDARMGISNGFALPAVAGAVKPYDDTGFTSRFRVRFDASGSTDTGLEFGAWARIHQGVQAEQGQKGAVYVSGAFGKLSMGDVDSAALKATGGHVNAIGLTGQDGNDFNELSYYGDEANNVSLIGRTVGGNTATRSAALYEYSANGFGFFASLSNPRNTDTLWRTKSYAVGGSYAIDAYKFGIAYETIETDHDTNPIKYEGSQWTIGADAEFSGVLLQARYIDGEVEQNSVKALDTRQYSIAATYTADALSVNGWLSRKEAEVTATGVNLFKRDAYGIGASYDLGGGAAVVGSVSKLKETTGTAASVSDTGYDLGLSFKF